MSLYGDSKWPARISKGAYSIGRESARTRTSSLSRAFISCLIAALLLITSATSPLLSSLTASQAYADVDTALYEDPSKPPLLTDTNSMVADVGDKLINVSDEELAEIFKTNSIAVLTGTANDIFLKSTHPEANAVQFTAFSDAIAALMAGKVDYVLLDLPSVMPYVNKNADIFLVNRSLTPYQVHFITAKGNTELVSKINGVLEKYKQDGTLEDLERRWVLNAGTDNCVMPEIPEADSDEVLRVAINYTGEPTMFYQNGKMVGYNPELCERIAYDLNMKVQMEDTPFASILAGVESDKTDCSLYFVKTEERMQYVDFSDPYLATPQVLITKKDVDTGGLLGKLSQSAYGTFIKDSRWMMIVQGLGVTVLISVCAFALANLIGALLCWLLMSRHVAANRIARIYNALIKGIPVLVLLMILYYVVFASIDIPSIVVAIITFGMFYGAMLCNVFYTGIKSVDEGQIEAAKALGFSPAQTFRHVILPNAANHSFDVYSDYFISLTKGTSIVGYVAILDLTKVGDILRAQTYDAFFPLIVTAVIYFAITYLFIFLFRRLKRFIDPSLRPRTVKGVDEHAWEASSAKEVGKRVDSMREQLALATGEGEIIGSRDTEEPAEVLVKAEGVEKSFGSNLIFKDVDFEVRERQIVSIIGPSGCGKSTLMRCVNMLEQPTAGTISFRGERIPENPAPRSAEAKQLFQIRQKVGMVFQSYNLFSHLMVVENLMLAPVKLLGMPRQEAFDNAMKLLDTMGLAGKAFSYPSELSGGQRQRVAIVRTLAMQPDIILLDEPTSALDPTMVREVTETIKGLAHRGMTMVIVTHDMDLARVVSTQVFYMDEKGIYEAGPPQQLFENPQRQKTREFLYSKAGIAIRFTKSNLDLIEMHAKLIGLAKEMRLGSRYEFDLCLVCEDIICNILLPQAPASDTPIEMNVYPVKPAGEMQISFKADFITTGCEEQCVDDLARDLLTAKTMRMESSDGLLLAAIELENN